MGFLALFDMLSRVILQGLGSYSSEDCSEQARVLIVAI